MQRELIPQTEILYSSRTGHLFSVIRLFPFHSNSLFASSSFDGTVRIWNDSKQERVLFYFSEAIEGLHITPNDKEIIVILADSSKAYIYNLESESLLTIGEDQLFRNIIGTNPSSTKTALVTFNDEVLIYNHQTRRISSSVLIENISGDSLIWINDEKFCVPKRNGSICIVDLDKKELKREIPVHDGLVTSICLNGGDIITVSEDGTGKVLDIDFNPKKGFKIDFLPISVDYNAKAKLIAVTGERNLLIINTRTGEILQLEQELSGSNAIILDDATIIKGSGEHDIIFIDINGNLKKKIEGRFHTAEFTAFLEENKLAIASGDNSVHLLDYCHHLDQILQTHKETVSAIIFSPQYNLLISGAYDDSLIIWDIINNRLRKQIDGLPLISALTLSPSSDKIAVGCSGDNTIHIFTIEGEELTKWEAHRDFISYLIFMSDEVLISGSDDSNIKFWKPDGKLISSIQEKSPIKSIETTIDFDYYITGHKNGALNIYEKVSNRKVAYHLASSQVQQIKIIDNKRILFASQNILHQIEFDGYHIVDIQEIDSHVEPIRGIMWYENPFRIISVSHAIEIHETLFKTKDISIPLIDEEDSGMVIYAPEDFEETSDQILKPESSDSKVIRAEIDEKNLGNVLDYLDTISKQFNDLIIPKLQIYGIEFNLFNESLDQIRIKIQNLIKDRQAIKQESDKNLNVRETTEDWKSIDWGGKKHNE
ncbi:MAG: hypothetical protein EAX86_02735 [Candidatus Heimdallarchaeota archaeon]|nr:hypothetical protein [Candidatus Heimdallarchaeota archaeon]